MGLFHALRKITLPTQCCSTYKSIAFDGCFFYLTSPDLCQIVKFNKDFCEIGRIDVSKPYSCICYDSHERCFWCSTSSHCATLFKLDCNFTEIDCISLNSESNGAIITGLSYDCGERRLIVTTLNRVLCVNTSACQNGELIAQVCSKCNMGVLAVFPSYIIIEIQDSKQYLAIYDCDFSLKCTIDIPKGYIAEDIIFDPCQPDICHNQHFYLLATKKCCSSHVIKCDLDCCELEICGCNFFSHEQCCCEQPCPTHSCNDVIESVALIEKALAEILHTEGMKLQKIIASSDDVNQILAANKAIDDVIVKITHLEIILHDKLATIKDCCRLENCSPNCHQNCESCCECGCESGYECGYESGCAPCC